MQTGKRAEHGFAYVLLLAAIACIGISASASLSLGSAVARRDAEEQLLAIGVEDPQFRQLTPRRTWRHGEPLRVEW